MLFNVIIHRFFKVSILTESIINYSIKKHGAGLNYSQLNIALNQAECLDDCAAFMSIHSPTSHGAHHPQRLLASCYLFGQCVSGWIQ
jgi:hypothetical protein